MTKIRDDVKNFVNVEDLLYTLRDNNMNTQDSVCELVDNSFDAGARNVWIDFGQDEATKEMWVVVQDDGAGIAKGNIRRALSLGGTMNERYSTKIGRFGMGLSNACASQSAFSVMASKTKDDAKIWANEIDFEYLKKNKAEFRETYELSDSFLLSKIKFKESGTMICWKVCDNLDKKKPATLHSSLIEIISRTYRYFMNSGHKIFLNNVEVELYDPLCRLENHRFKDEYGIQKIYGDPVVIPVKYLDEQGVEKTSNVVVDLVLMDYARIMAAPGLKAKLGIGMRGQGFYLIRNNRAIGAPEWFGTATQKFDWLNYIRGEIRFDSVLDKHFGIGHNKSRAYPKDVILDALKKDVAPKVTLALGESKRAKDQWEAAQKDHSSELAIRIHESSKEVTVPDEKLEVVVTKPAQKKGAPKSKSELKEELFKKVDANPTLGKEIRESRKRRITEVLESPYSEGIVICNDGPAAPFFRVEVVDAKRVILVNGDHKFYEYVYEPTSGSQYWHTIVDMVFYALADVRDGLQDDKFVQVFDQIVERFSRRYGVMFNQKDFAEALTLSRETSSE